MIELETLRGLVDRGDGNDRAFVDGVIRMGWPRAEGPTRAELAVLLDGLRAVTSRAHAALRQRIASGELRGRTLRAMFDDVPALERDHFVEEVLGIAYPPLDEPELGPELIAYMPSGYDEIVHALDATELKAGERFLDVGSGTGKAVLLAALLTGATGVGVECNGALVDLAERAARDLGVSDASFSHGDARECELAPADVVFMYLPFTGTVLANVLARLTTAESRPRGRYLCAGALDLERHAGIVRAGPPSSWLQVYTFVD
jgi:protein-L-isoaspartate O-methyltransferase